MNPPKLQTRLHAITVLIYLAVFAAIPALAAPKKAATPAPDASPAATATPAAKAKPFPFKNTVVSVDKATNTFTIGKKTAHKVHVLPETKVLKGDETAATFEEIIVGVEVRGSVKKRADGDWEAVSVKIGPKAEASPSPSPSPAAKATPAKAAASPAASAPSPSPKP